VIRALIVDDEPIARETLRLGLGADPEVTVVGEASGAEAVPLVAATRPDLLLLDVQMPGMNGFEVLEAIGPGTVPVVIFVTAYDQYALKAFEVHALDYLLKPFDDRRLGETLARAKVQLRSAQAQSIEARLVNFLEEHERAARPYLERFVVRGRDKTLFVPCEAVDWIRGADDYVELHAGRDAHLLRERLADLEARLDPGRFARIHRSTIVNLDRVRELHPLFRGDCEIVLRDGARLRLSRSRRAEFEERLSGSPRQRLESPQSR
jgi:two-component system LytT family response regulator